jgi:hypothetical protein
MSDPNSRSTRFRRRLARVITPGPAPGEAWCVDCALNEGRTLVVSADGTWDHIRRHTRELPGRRVGIQSAWPRAWDEVADAE